MDLYRSTQSTGVGIMVLSGSSGRVDTGRAQLFADHGAVALPLQWFGGKGQQPGPWEVPIETFVRALDVVAHEVDRLAIVGVSFGAEAALVTATLDPRVQTVVALSPSSVVWSGFDLQQRRWASHWTWRGQPLPFVQVRPRAQLASPTPPSYRVAYEASLEAATTEERSLATIPVERIPEVVLVSGGDDQVWPSAQFAQEIIDRRAVAGLASEHVHLPEAGHRTTLPGEPAPGDGIPMARGGTPAADAALGALAWPRIRNALGLR